MVRAGLQSGVAPGFRANVVLGGKLRFVSDLQLPAHGPASAVRAGHPLLPRSRARHSGTVGRNWRPDAVRSGSAYRPDAAWKGRLPGKRISRLGIPASRVVPEIRQSVHETIREKTCQTDRIKSENYRRPQPGPDRRMPRQPGIPLHRRSAIAKPARTDRPRRKEPSQRQDRHPRAGPRRGRRAPGRDPARKAEGPAPRHRPETPTARERRLERRRQRRRKKLKCTQQKAANEGPGGLSSMQHARARRDHPTCTAKSSLKSAANRRNPALLENRRQARTLATSGITFAG